MGTNHTLLKQSVPRCNLNLADLLCQVGHKDYVGPMAYLPPGLVAELPNGALVTGGL